MRTTLAVLLTLGCSTASSRAVEPATYIEQEVVREQVRGQPAIKGLQRIWFTGRHIRSETSYGRHKSVAILDAQTERIVLIPSEQKQYVELTLGEYHRLVAMRLSSAGLNGDQADARLVKTDQTRQVGDWHCTRYVFEQNGKLPIKAELWVARDAGVDFSAWLQLMDRLGLIRTLGHIGKFVRRIDGLPIEVRTEQTVFDQTLVTTSRVRKIRVAEVDPALFRVPAGFERLEAEPMSE